MRNLFEYRSCEFSPDRVYRYALRIAWRAEHGYVIFIGLNPSIADEEVDDPTVRRVCAYADRWGFGGVTMLNLFAYRATDPARMRAVRDPVGPANDATLDREILRPLETPIAIAAWGTLGTHRNRCYDVERRLRGYLCCLRVTRDGHPAHPLYLPAGLRPQPFNYVV
jgi:hypothetical protein